MVVAFYSSRRRRAGASQSKSTFLPLWLFLGHTGLSAAGSTPALLARGIRPGSPTPSGMAGRCVGRFDAFLPSDRLAPSCRFSLRSSRLPWIVFGGRVLKMKRWESGAPEAPSFPSIYSTIFRPSADGFGTAFSDEKRPRSRGLISWNFRHWLRLVSLPSTSRSHRLPVACIGVPRRCRSKP